MFCRILDDRSNLSHGFVVVAEALRQPLHLVCNVVLVANLPPVDPSDRSSHVTCDRDMRSFLWLGVRMWMCRLEELVHAVNQRSTVAAGLPLGFLYCATIERRLPLERQKWECHFFTCVEGGKYPFFGECERALEAWGAQIRQVTAKVAYGVVRARSLEVIEPLL